MIWLLLSQLQEMVSLVQPDQPQHQHSRGLLVFLVTPDLQGQFYGLLPPQAGVLSHLDPNPTPQSLFCWYNLRDA